MGWSPRISYILTGGGCSVPQAVHSWIEDDQLYMKGAVFNLDGSKSLLETMQTSLLVEDQHVLEVVDPESCCEFASITTSHRFIHPMLLKVAGHLGRDLALLLLGKGAREILDEARRQNMERVDDVI
uniref:Porphobilinogen deaminase C-terminal domain-containing protein n=1 Tax=Ciona savignyi TaxID=51511 RepID=H2ZDA4_CIOSA